jgi:hypothetical protein
VVSLDGISCKTLDKSHGGALEKIKKPKEISSQLSQSLYEPRTISNAKNSF